MEKKREITKKCDYCKKDFIPRRPDRKNRPNRFCSQECYFKWRKENKVTFAKTNKTSKKCEYCKSYFIPRSGKPNRFCSTDCYFKYRKENSTFNINEYKHQYYLKKRNESNKIQSERNKRLRLMVLDVLGGKCKNCGFLDFRALQIDHINGDGIKDRKTAGNRYYKQIIEMDEEKRNLKYQCLCANCNWIKRHERREERSRVYGEKEKDKTFE